MPKVKLLDGSVIIFNYNSVTMEDKTFDVHLRSHNGNVETYFMRDHETYSCISLTSRFGKVNTLTFWNKVTKKGERHQVVSTNGSPSSNNVKRIMLKGGPSIELPMNLYELTKDAVIQIGDVAHVVIDIMFDRTEDLIKLASGDIISIKKDDKSNQICVNLRGHNYPICDRIYE